MERGLRETSQGTYNTNFFDISTSSIVSKWRGDSEKLVRVGTVQASLISQ